MRKRLSAGVKRAILTAAITGTLACGTLVASQGAGNLLLRLEREAGHTAQSAGALRLGGPAMANGVRPIGAIARSAQPLARHLGDPVPGAVTRNDRDLWDVEDGDRDDSHGHHHHHHHHHHP